MPFWETWNLLHENYVDPLDDTALMESALRMMQSSAIPTPTIWTRTRSLASTRA